MKSLRWDRIFIFVVIPVFFWSVVGFLFYLIWSIL